MSMLTPVLGLLIAAAALSAVPRPARAQAPAQITIAQPAEATTMDPGRSTQVLTVNYFYNLYDTLVRWDTALKLVPGLATCRSVAPSLTPTSATTRRSSPIPTIRHRPSGSWPRRAIRAASTS